MVPVSGLQAIMVSVATGLGQRQAPPYDVSIHGSTAGIKLIPSQLVSNSEYRPSKDVHDQIADMWLRGSPRVIGTVSEAIAMEILGGGRIEMDGYARALSCCKLRNVQEISGLWRPKRGIYCDDLVAIAIGNGDKVLFLSEVKGTILEAGLSRSMEAKIFYQLARTCVRLSELMPSAPCYPVKGAITVTILHFSGKINVNILTAEAIKGYFPDGWLQPGERY